MGAPGGFERLSALDETFVHLERPETPMQVGAVAVLERPPLVDETGSVRLDGVRALVRSRLQLVPKFRRRVVAAPFVAGRHLWVDDPRFVIEDHVRLTSLPAPGRRRDLLALAERLMSRPLDPERALWELWLVDGVDRGEHVGIVYRSHHALADGVSGVEIALALFDFTETPTVLDDDGWQPAAWPEARDVVVDAVEHAGRVPAQVATLVRRAVDAPDESVERAAGLGRALRGLFEGPLFAPRLSINEPIGPGRSIVTFRVPLDAFRDAGARFGATVNDVVLACVAGGVARVLDARGELCPGLEVHAFCPVSTRADDDRRALGNQLAAMLVPLPVADSDVARRIALVRERTATRKANGQAEGIGALFVLGELAAPPLLGLVARVAHAQPFANLMVTNMAGPNRPLFCLGARALELYPLAPLSRNLTLTVAVLSYAGELHVGLLGAGGDRPDLERLAGGIEDACAELGELTKEGR
jgi:WS/DGAT/MGAT family acyltransferase